MPARSQTIIRRDINRLKETIDQNITDYPALLAIQDAVASKAGSVNAAWQQYQQAAVDGDRERAERVAATGILLDWVQMWRPVIMILVAGADQNIRNLPANGGTPDDVIIVGQDMVEFINNNAGAETFREAAIADLGEKLVTARKELQEATAALPAEAAAREYYAESTLEANDTLVKGISIIRTIFGRTSPAYKQFI